MGNRKSEMRTQAMKMPIPPSEFALPPSHEKLLTGFLISIDLSERQLIIHLNDKKYRHLIFPQSLQIAPYLLGHLVTIQLEEEIKGKSIVQQIRLAA